MMAWLRLALGNLRANRRRTGITLLSLTVGVAGLVFLWAFIDGINAQMINNMTGYVTGDLKVHARLPQRAGNEHRFAGTMESATRGG